MVIASPEGRLSTKTKGLFYQKGNLESRDSISESQQFHRLGLSLWNLNAAFFLKSGLDIEM